MLKNCKYDPRPPRVWSRVQNPCTYIMPGDTYPKALRSSPWSTAYDPLTGKTDPFAKGPLVRDSFAQGPAGGTGFAQALYQTQMLNKGNVLQYKINSAQLTKSQKYSQLVRCAGPSRTKVFATQGETYSNPNTRGMQRTGFITYPFPNQIPGAPNNPSSNFVFGGPNPDGCPTKDIRDGGTLVCGTLVDPCTNEMVREPTAFAGTICHSASASDVPGPGILCWNPRIQSWFPKPRYFMNNSTDKWPINYKGLVSAVTFTA